MSWAQGFSAGFGSVLNAQRLYQQGQENGEQQKDREQARAVRAIQLRQLEQDMTDRQALRDAAAGTSPATAPAPTAAPTAAGAPAPAASPAFGATLMQRMDAGDEGAPQYSVAPAPAPTPAQPGFGAQVLQGSGAAPSPASGTGSVVMPAAAPPPRTQFATTQAMAEALQRQGKVVEANQLRDSAARWQQEGVDRAMDVILAGGDGDQARAAYDALGKDRFGEGDGIKVLRRYQVQRPGYAPIDTAEVEITRNGQKQVVPDLFAVRYKLAEQAMDLARQGYQAGRDKVADERNARTDARLEAAQAVTAEYQRGMLRAAEMRASGAGGESENAPLGLTAKDRADGHKRIADLAGDQFNIKEELNPDLRQTAIRQRASFVESAQTLFDQAYAAGISISADEAVGAAAKVASDKGALNKTGNWITVTINGREIPVRPFKAAAAPTPAAAAPARASAAPAPAARDQRPDFAAQPELSPADLAQQRELDAQRERAAGDRLGRPDRAITPERIRAMTPDEARAALETYGGELSGRQRAALNQRLR